MKKILVTLTLLLFAIITQATPPREEKSLVAELAGTWQIKNVQKMIGAIRTKKYTKDGGDPKAYIKRFKGCTLNLKADSTVELVSADGKRTYEGKWGFRTDTKYRVKTGTITQPHDNGHTDSLLNLYIELPTARRYNIEGEYRAHQFGLVKVAGKFAVVDTKYMFKFERVDEEE